MPKMVCVDCQTELEIKTNGVDAIEMFGNPPKPYKIWQADLWECPSCQKEVVAGFAEYPIAEHYQEKFNTILEHVKSLSSTNNRKIYYF